MRSIWYLFAVFGITGCSSSSYILKSADVSSSSLVTDAKQRVIVSFPPASGTGQESRRIVCAEPSPDVAQALSDAIKAGLSLDLSKAGTTDPQAKTLGFDFGKSSAASIAQLGERLAVVQLLRDRMYRACEAYANRAIGEAAYTLLMARNDKTMMSLLSNELAAGAFGRNLAVLGGGQAGVGVSAGELSTQQAAVNKASEDFAKVAGGESPKKEDIEAAQKKLTEEVAKLVALERQSSVTAASSVPLGQMSGANPSKAADLSVLQEMQRNYLDDDGIDPLVDACIIGVEKLTTNNADAQNYIRSIANQAESARNRAVQIGETLDRMRLDLANAQARLGRAKGEASRVRALSLNDPASPAVANADAEVEAIRADIDSYQMRIQDQFRERESLAGTKGIEPKDLYMATGSPFAAFCFQSVLAGDSKFMNIRMQQKRKLRGLEDPEDFILGKQLEVCLTAMKSDKDAIDPTIRSALMGTCNEVLKRGAPRKEAAAP